MRALAFVLLVAFSLMFAPPVSASTWGVGRPSESAEAIVRGLINGEHSRVCGKTLDHRPKLGWAARYKAMDMGYRDTLSHAFVDDSRIRDFYPEVRIDFSHGAGEIIGVNTYSDSGSPRRIFEGWMASPDHRGAIRNCDYDRFGVGAFQTKGGNSGTKWYAVEFTNPR